MGCGRAIPGAHARQDGRIMPRPTTTAARTFMNNADRPDEPKPTATTQLRQPEPTAAPPSRRNRLQSDRARDGVTAPPLRNMGHSPMRAYSTREVAELLGVAPARVRALARTVIAEPARDERGRLRFSFQDIVMLRQAQGLLNGHEHPRRVW